MALPNLKMTQIGSRGKEKQGERRVGRGGVVGKGSRGGGNPGP